MTGAGTGMSIAGPWGAALGSIAGGVAGYFSGQENNKAAARAKSAANAIPLVNPETVAQLSRERQLERAQRAGADQASAFGARNVNGVLGQTQANITRAVGGNPALALSGLLGAQSQADSAIQGLGANAGARADNSLAAQYGIIGDMERRKRDLQEFARNQAYSELIAGRQNINNTVSAGLGLLPGLNLDKLPNFRKAAESQNMGGAWRTMGAGGTTPAAPTPAPQYTMLPGSVQSPTSEYDMGQQVML